MSTFVGILAVVVLVPGAVATIHLTVLSLASLFYRTRRSGEAPPMRFLVVIPARNEEAVIGATLGSVSAALRDGDIVLLVADRCDDRTAEIGREAGVEVLERSEGDTPGRAATIAAGIEHASAWEWDAVTTIDADSVINQGFFDALARSVSQETPIAQPRSEHIREPGVLKRIAEMAFAMQGVTLPRGRTVLGVGVRLRGSGMTMHRRIVEQYAISGGASEDLFYSMRLILDDVVAVHVDDARLRSLAAGSLRAGRAQRTRWEVGRMAAARSHAVPLLKHGSRTALDTATLLLTPPFAVAVFLLLVASGLFWLAGWTGALAASLGLTVAMAVDVAIALLQTRAPWQTWGALVAAPFYIVWKAAIQVMAIARFRTSDEAYEPTPRE